MNLENKLMIIKLSTYLNYCILYAATLKAHTIEYS